MPNLFKTVAAYIAATLLLSACSGIGDGTKPDMLKIVQITPDTLLNEDFIRGEQIPGKAYTCVRGVLQAFIFFDDGNVGNFTRRVKWTSSDPSILTVSNFDEVVPGTPENKFDYGSIAPLAPGSVTVTATYLGMTATIPITVDAAGAIEITPADARLAPRSFQALRATAMLGDEEVDLTSQTVFTLDGNDDDFEPDPSDPTDTDNYLAVGDATISAIAVSDPQTIRGRLNVAGGACATSPSAESTARIQIAAIPDRPTPNPMNLGLTLSPEDGFTTTLAEGTSQILKLIARFGDFNSDGDAEDPNEFQELTFQFASTAVFTSSNTAAVVFVGSTLLGRGSVVAAVQDVEDVGVAPADATSDLVGKFGDAPAAMPPIVGASSNTLPMAVRDLPLRTIEIRSSAERDPSEGNCAVTDTFGAVPPTLTAGKSLCLRAIGTFGPGEAATASDYVQDISKDVEWTTLRTNSLGVLTGRTVGAGFVTTATRPTTSGACDGDDMCEETITASFSFSRRGAADVIELVRRTATADVTVIFPTPAP